MHQPHTVTALLDELEGQLASGSAHERRAIPLGFDAFDQAVGGGVRRGDLTVFAGPPGVGKTILGLQAARHLAATGRPALYVCYEHDQQALLARLLAQEASGNDPRGRTLVALEELLGTTHGGIDLQDRLNRDPQLHEAFTNLSAIGDHLHLLTGSARDTGLDEIDELVSTVTATAALPPVLVIDYLQKVPTGDRDGVARSRRVVEGLKDLAMHHDIPVLALASLTAGGLEARKLRLSHLDETSSIAFEADVVVLLNDKVDAVAKAHLSYGGVAVQDYPNWVVWGIAKNRAGPNLHNIEFQKDFEHFRFHPKGRTVSERMADDRLAGDAG